MTGKLFRQIKSRFDPELYGWSSHIRWPLMSIAVGSVSGLGAIFFRDVATPNVVRVFGEDSLQMALDKMIQLNVDELPVVRKEAPDEIVAMISKRDIIGYYHSKTGTAGPKVSS